MAGIKLEGIWPIVNPKDYKIHFARRNKKGEEPLDVFVRDKNQWQSWNEYRPTNNDFNRKYIFSLMQDYNSNDLWLFGGTFEILNRLPDKYELQLIDIGRHFIGRMKLHSPYNKRATRVDLENYYGDFIVEEILSEPFNGRPFPGYGNIDLSFSELAGLVRNKQPDWKHALENTKGIYLITDQSTEYRYVGSAYGENGVWSRWSNYADNGHGGNKALRELQVAGNLEIFRSNARISLLEICLANADDCFVIGRESYWKKILLTRGEKGLNRN